MIPSKSQWKSWSLPSKYSAIGLIVGVLSLLVALVYPISPNHENRKVIEGEYTLRTLGVHEINYGYSFKSKPILEFLGGKYGGISNPDRFEILSQSNSGFVIKVGGALTSGTSIRWRATGEN